VKVLVDEVIQYQDHLWLAGHQYRKSELHLESLQDNQELWMFDFSTSFHLWQSLKQSQAEDLKRDYATCLGVCIYRKSATGKLLKQHHDFFGVNKSNDFYYAICCLDYLLNKAQNRNFI